MIRRLKTALFVALGIIAVLAIVVIGGASVVLKTDWGNDLVRRRVEAAIKGTVGDRGTVTLGAMSLSPIGTFSLDSFVVRDRQGAVAIATGAVRARYAIGPLLDNEIHIALVTLERPRLAYAQGRDGKWNIQTLFAGDTATKGPGVPSPWRIRIDSLEMIDGLVSVTQPDTLPSLPMRTTGYGPLQLNLGASRFTLASRTGDLTVRHLAAELDAPPLPIRHASGTIRLAKDSVILALDTLRLPATRGAVTGAISWADTTATRLALRIDARDVAFTDIAWITPLIPKSGRGRAVVHIANGPGPGVIRYAIDSLDATATDSRLRGRLLADVGRDVAIRDLDLSLEPLDFTLVHEIFGDSLPPEPWDGTVRGRLRARGGKLGAWRLDPSTLEFEDRRAGGARSRLTVSGQLDLLGTTTRLAPLDVVLDSLDVRTVGAVTEVADSLDGYLRGRVRLDGPVDDLRFSGLDVVHVDGPAPPSHIRGEGRLALDTSRTWLEARLTLDTVSFGALAKPFTTTPMRGTMSGRLATSARGDSVHLDLALADGEASLAFTGATTLDTARLVLKGDLRAERLDARRYLTDPDLPAHRVTARARLGLDAPWSAPAGPIEFAIDSTTEVAGFAITTGEARIALEPGGIRIDTLTLASPLGRATAHGRLSRDPAVRELLRFEATIDSLARVAGFLPESLQVAWKDSLGGQVTLRGAAMGSLDTLDISAEWEAAGLRAGSQGVRSAEGTVTLTGFPSATTGLVTARADSVRFGTLPVDTLELTAMVREASWADATVRIVAGDSLVATTRADVHWMKDSVDIRVDSVSADTRDARWALRAPATARWEPRRLRIDTIALVARDGARLDLAAQIDTTGPINAFVRLVRVPIAHAGFTGLLPEGVNGLVSLEAQISGTAALPVMKVSGTLDSATVNGRAVPGLALRGDYASRVFDVDLRGRADGRDAFVLTGNLPLDLTFESRTLEQRFIKEPLFLRFVADGTSLTGFEALMPEVRELKGAFDADVLIGGRWDDLEPRGVLLVRDGSFALPALETGFRDFLMDVQLAPDSVIIHRARLADVKSPNDTASIEGAFARVGGRWTADLRSMGRNVRIMDDPRVAEADVSWNVRLRGALDSLVLGGQVTVPNANAYIGGARRQVLALDSAEVEANGASRYMPRIEQLRVRLGNEVRLRSAEANVQLTGEIAVTGTIDSPDLRGEVIANRGTYRLDLGLLQRTFQVDSGTVVLNGPVDGAHALDIHTTYTVRQPDREDVHIGARLTGTTLQPRIQLTSSDLGTTATETEIISYLLFGAPSFALDGQRSSTLRTASAALAPSLGGAVERALGGKIPYVSELRVSTVADEQGVASLSSFEGLLNSFKLIAGMQLGTDSFLRVSTGVCRGESAGASALPVWFGIAAEYQPRERLSAQLSLDPGSSPCRRVGSFGQIYQVGLDLFREWRW